MTYLLDNAAPQTGGRFGGLEACYDHATFGYLSGLGLGKGWRCWELGAGGGSVARWMGRAVGVSGSVLATDLNLDWIDGDMPPQVELRCHDVISDEIPTAAFDLIHARLVLVHLPARDEVIDRLVAALAPDGWLVLEEFAEILPACPEPASTEQRTFNRVLDAFSELLVRRGANTNSYPRTLPWRMRRAGLTQTGAEGRLLFTTGGSPGAAVMRANLLQTGSHAVETGLITEADLTTFLRLLDDPEFTFAMPLLVTAWGCRQPSASG